MIKTIEDMDFAYYNLTYLLSMGCSGSFCSKCIYKETKESRCLKWSMRKIVGLKTDRENRTIETQTDLIDLIDMIKETCHDTCSLSGYCFAGKCKFYNNTDGEPVCNRMAIRDLILNFERKQA